MIHAGYLYYDISLDDSDFSLLTNEALNSSFSKECEVYKTYKYFNRWYFNRKCVFFFWIYFFRKIIAKHYNLDQQFNNYFFEFTQEMFIVLLKIAGDINNNEKKKIINKCFCNDGYFQELLFV